MTKVFGVLFIIALGLIVVSNRLNAPSASSPTVTPPPTIAATAPTSINTPAPINFTADTQANVVAQNIATITPAASPTIPPDAKMHVVQRGETVYRISQQYSVSMESIAATNGLTDMSRIFVGQELWIPAVTAPTRTAQPIPATATLTLEPTLFVPTITPLPLTTTPITNLYVTATNIEPTQVAALPPVPSTVNGVGIETFVVLPEAVRTNVMQIFLRGLELNRNPRAFSKLGDSTIENPFFLARFDDEPYNLGEYGYLQSVIDFYAGSFGRESMAVKRGLHTWSAFDPMWTDAPQCLAREGLLECEVRLNNPSVMFVRLGSNDVGVPEMTEENFRKIIEFLITNGIIPIMGTKADRHEDSHNTNNNMMRRLAAEYRIPLWDFDLVAQTLPNRGLDQDGVHMTSFFAHDWTSPIGFQRGHGVHNLTALIALDAVWRVVAG